MSVQNQDFYLEEQQKKIEEHFTEAIEIARMSGIKLDTLQLAEWYLTMITISLLRYR